MSYNGSGVFVINSTGQPVVTGTVISSSVFNSLTSDLATGLSTAITKDGQTTITANIPFGNNKITGLAVATTSGDALSYGQAATVSTLTVSGLTSGRVPYATTAGLLTDSANLTFNGTTLTANTIGAFTLSGTIAGGGNQINNVVIGTSTPLAGSFTTVSATTSVTTPSVTNAGTLALSATGANIMTASTNGSERMRIDSSGNVLVTSVAGLGYGTGSGGTVTQATSKSTGVTLNKPTGQITMNAAALASETIVSFVLTNTVVAATDLILINHVSGGTGGAYTINGGCAAGGVTINVRNNTAGSLSEALVLSFAVIKGATS